MKRQIISNEYRISMSEVLEILKYFPESTSDKIPTEFISFLEDNSIRNFESKSDYSQSLDKIPLSNETKSLLALIYRNYLCTEEERVEYDRILHGSEEICQESLREKDNSNNIFKNNQISKNEDSPSTALIEYKKVKWYKKIIQRIIDFFK